jgi:ATP-dependent Lon protease
VVEGAQRAKVVKYTDCSEYYQAEAVALGDTMGERVEAKALVSVRKHIESLESVVIQRWWPDSGRVTDVDTAEP